MCTPVNVEASPGEPKSPSKTSTPASFSRSIRSFFPGRVSDRTNTTTCTSSRARHSANTQPKEPVAPKTSTRFATLLGSKLPIGKWYAVQQREGYSTGFHWQMSLLGSRLVGSCPTQFVS